MKPKDLWNRVNNLLAVSIVGLAGFAFLPEMILEGEWRFKIDEGILLVLAVWAVVWYLKGDNKFS